MVLLVEEGWLNLPTNTVRPQRHDGVLQRKAVVATRGMEPATKTGIVDGSTPTVVWALPDMCDWDMDVSSSNAC